MDFANFWPLGPLTLILALTLQLALKDTPSLKRFMRHIWIGAIFVTATSGGYASAAYVLNG